MERTIRNMTRQSLTVAQKLENGSMDILLIPVREPVTIDESQITPDMLIKQERGLIQIT